MGYAQKPPYVTPLKKGEFNSTSNQSYTPPKDPQAAQWKQFHADVTAYAKTKETRMRAYAILADALTGQGKTEDARLYRNVVTAIRRGEAADELGELGLWTRAIAGYRQVLTFFVNAYCVQSRRRFNWPNRAI